MSEHTIDVQVQNEGALFAFHPLTPAGRDWLNERVHAEPHTWRGHVLCVEYRYVHDIILAMRRDRLRLELSL